MAVSAAELATQNSTMTQAVLEAYKSNEKFQALSERLCKEIMNRDIEDGEKLARGVQLAVSKGVLSADVKVEETTKVSVMGKGAEQVADEIMQKLGCAAAQGCVMILTGLSGTGKGTTVAKLQENLPNAVTWSNGNVFRSVTLLALTYAEQNGCSLQETLTPELLKTFFGMLEFDKFGDKFDVKIEGLGLKYFVSEVEKTVLKDSSIGKNIPTVAEVTQGEVVNFVNVAVQKMASGGMNVLVEGREQTLNHVRSPHRFELVLEDCTIIGQRQAALQMGAKAWDIVGKSPVASSEDVVKALDDALEQLCA